MKQRKWSGSWSSGKLKNSYEPFGQPAHVGQRVYFRPCDWGIAVFASGTGATWIRYLTSEEVKMSCMDIKPEPDTGRIERRFDLARGELREMAGHGALPTIIGEVPVPSGQPKNYGGARVHVGTGLSYLTEPVFFADHFFDHDGQPQIVWEKQVLHAALSMKDQDFLTKTYKHETQERRIKYRDMIAEFGQVKPEAVDALSRQFNGIAHDAVVHSVEGFKTIAAYDGFLARWAARAKLPSPPAPNELS